MTTPLADRAHWVYLVKGEAGQLLYVGCTSDLNQRWGFHESHSPWWHLMVDTEHFGTFTRRDALDAEQQVIWTLGPLCNRPQKGDYKAFGLNWRNEMGSLRYSNAEAREIRRRNRNEIPAERQALLMVRMREGLQNLADVLVPDVQSAARKPAA